MGNRLADATSLYLRQHADNPVDWHPWGDDALALARRERRPLLLSIGYSACHWCHVMAHESFEDAGTAAVMNHLFVNVKIDREERPDLDRIYQLAHQALQRTSGGWPLTVFVDPDDLLPFFTGTYFPPQPRHGLPAFVEVLRAVRAWYDAHPDQRREQGAALSTFLRDMASDTAADAAPPPAQARAALDRLAADFDAAHGGHRGGPKFPHPTELALLRRFADEGDADAARMRTLTLHGMARGGLQDHLGGGFFRYCVDARWTIPHFEKMLYDNAALLPEYALAARDGDAVCADAAEGIVRWLQRDLRAEDGGWCASMDADSPGGEGAFYVWRLREVQSLLDEDEAAVAIPAFGLDGPANFEGKAWHLQRAASLAAIASRLRINEDEARLRLTRASAKLLAHRDSREPPARDDKRLTAWNAMTASALARAGRAMGREDWIDNAVATLAFLRGRCWRSGFLHSTYAAGQAQGPRFLDDHALALDAALDVLTARWDGALLRWAIALADAMLGHFHDRDDGGFFFTAHDHEPLPQRPKPWFDESTPSGNGVAARALQRLGWLLAEPRWLDAAESTLRAGAAALSRAPHGCCTLALALIDHHAPPPVVIVRLAAHERERWASLTRTDGDVYVISADAPDLPPALADKRHLDGGCAYVCRGLRCLAPARSPDELAQRL